MVTIVSNINNASEEEEEEEEAKTLEVFTQ